MGAVHQLNIYCPVLCCSSSPAEPPEDGRQGPTTAGLQRQAAPGRLRGWCQSTATRAGAAGPGPVPAPAASDGEGWRAAPPDAPHASPQPRRRRRSAEPRGPGRPRERQPAPGMHARLPRPGTSRRSRRRAGAGDAAAELITNSLARSLRELRPRAPRSRQPERGERGAPPREPTGTSPTPGPPRPAARRLRPSTPTFPQARLDSSLSPPRRSAACGARRPARSGAQCAPPPCPAVPRGGGRAASAEAWGRPHVRRLRQSGPPAGRPPPPPPPSRVAREPAAWRGGAGGMLGRSGGCAGRKLAWEAGGNKRVGAEFGSDEGREALLRFCSGAARRLRARGAAVEPGWRQRRSARALRRTGVRPPRPGSLPRAGFRRGRSPAGAAGAGGGARRRN